MVADVWEKDVWDFHAKSGSSGSCPPFLHFLGKSGKASKSQTFFYQTSATSQEKASKINKNRLRVALQISHGRWGKTTPKGRRWGDGMGGGGRSLLSENWEVVGGLPERQPNMGRSFFFREKQRGVENSGEGKTYRKTPPQKRFWNPPPSIIRFPGFVHAPVIFRRGNGHRPDESHFWRPPKLVFSIVRFPPLPNRTIRFAPPLFAISQFYLRLGLSYLWLVFVACYGKLALSFLLTVEVRLLTVENRFWSVLLMAPTVQNSDLIIFTYGSPTVSKKDEL